MSIKHLKVSAKADGPDPGNVHASDWNAVHDLSALVAGDVSDFAEAVDDRVSALLKAGANVTLTYDDAAGTLTISSTGGGGGGGSGDANFANVVLLMHMDGSLIDSSTSAKTMTAVGSAATSTTQKQWGSASLRTNGSGQGVVSAGSLSDFDFGSGDFTIEAWVYVATFTGTNGVVCKRATTAVFAPFSLFTEASTGKPGFWLSTGGSAWDVQILGSTPVTISAFSFWQAVRSGSTVTLYVNGVSVGSAAISGALMSNTDGLSIGCGSALGGSFSLDGYIDDVRITKGVARPNAVPTAAFPDSISGGSGGTPGGATTQIQFNDGGVFAGDADLTWDKTGNVLTVPAVKGATSLRLQPGATGNIQLDGGKGAALATTATDGFVTLPSTAGTPTGAPADVPTGSVATVFDTTGGKPWYYLGVAPTVYATWNPADKGSACVLSSGNLTATGPQSNGSVRSTIGKSSGKWYCEITSTGARYPLVGVANASATLTKWPGFDANGWGYYGFIANKVNNSVFADYGTLWNAPTQVVGIALDMTAGTVEFFKNGVSMGVAYTGLTGTIFIMTGGDSDTGSPTLSNTTANFGATAFAYPVPAGYKPGFYSGPDPAVIADKLLLHCDGADQSTVFFDSSTIAATILASGDAKVSTAQSVFGGAALALDGAGDYLTTPAGADYDLGLISASTNATFEARLRFSGTGQYQIAAHAVPGSGGSGRGGWDLYVSVGRLRLTVCTNTSVSNSTPGWVAMWETLGQPVAVTNRWYHVAMVIRAGVPHIYVDGAEQAGQWLSGTNFGTSLIGMLTTRADFGLRLGASHTDTNNPTPADFFSGYMDEVRWSNTTAYYAADFTPPVAAFPGAVSPAWVSPGVPEAPNDANTYGRNALAWAAITKTTVGLSNVLNVAQEPAIAAGTSAQYWRGDKVWTALPPAGAKTTIDDTAPASPAYGDRWIKPSNMTEMVWVPNAGQPGIWINPADAAVALQVAYPIAINKGGTGATTAPAALLNLGVTNAAGQNILGDGTVAAPGLAFNSEPGLGWYRSAASEISVAAAGARTVMFGSGDPASTLLQMWPRAPGTSLIALQNQVLGAANSNQLIVQLAPNGNAYIQTGANGSATRGNLILDAPTVQATNLIYADGGFSFNAARPANGLSSNGFSSGGVLGRFVELLVASSVGASMDVNANYDGSSVAFWRINSAGATFDFVNDGRAVKSAGSTAWIIGSDERLKENIRPYEHGLDEILQLEPIRYTRIGMEGEYIGVSAQKAQGPMPEMISEDKNGYLQLDDAPATWALVNAIKTLHERLSRLELHPA